MKIEQNFSQLIASLIDPEDCCTSIYHLHYHHLHFYNNTSEVFNSTLQEIIKTNIFKQDNGHLMVNSMTDITVIIFFFCCVVTFILMLVSYIKFYSKRPE